MKYSLKMLIGSILAGLVYALIAEPFVRIGERVLPGMVIVPVYFLGLFLVLGLAVFLISKITYSSTQSRINMKQWVITLVLIIGLSLLFEFIYEVVRPKAKTKDFDSYIFILDDSGSMIQNDPNYLRYQAIDKLLEDKSPDFKYAVYSFSTECTMLRSMQPISAGEFNPTLYSDGLTEIKATLTQVMDDIESGAMTLGKNTRIIFLSDGYATDVDFWTKGTLVPLLDKYAEKEVSISTVGLMYADKSLMSMIADKTGGEYINVDNIDDLIQGMTQAGKMNLAKRHLLGWRPRADFAVLLGILRVLFVGILGVVIAVEKTVLCEKFLNTNSVLYSSAISSILAGICIEIGMNAIGVQPTIMRTMTCILIAFTLLREDLFLQLTAGNDAQMSGY